MKITKTLTIASILSLAAVGSAFADVTFDDSATVTMGAPTMAVKPSKNVKVVYKPSTATTGNGSVAYAISAAHSSGSKTFASSSGDTKIFMMDGTTNVGPASPEAAGATADFGAGWTPL